MITLTGKQKALIFLASLGEEVASKILAKLPNTLADKLAEELDKMEPPSPEAIQLIYKELNTLALGFTERPKLVSPEIKPAAPKPSAKELLMLLQNEQLQTIAFILNSLPEELQSECYEAMNPGRRNELKKLTIQKHPLSDAIYEQIRKKALAAVLH